MPRLPATFILTALAWLVLGISMGIYMSAAKDFALRPVHAHINLIGWVTNALMGFFYWLQPAAAGRIGWAGFASLNLGAAAMLAALTALLLGHPDGPLAIGLPLGAPVVALGILLFASRVVSAARRGN